MECRKTCRSEDTAVNRAAVVPAAGKLMGLADRRDGQVGSAVKADPSFPSEIASWVKGEHQG